MELYNITLSSSFYGLLDFKKYIGTPLVIFNSASLCGFTNQLEQFQKLYKTGKMIPIAIPTNNFGEQEPGNDHEIKQFYTKKYNIEFPIIDKTTIENEFFKMFGQPDWNFNKFLFDKNHKFIKQFNAYFRPVDLLKYV